MTTAFVTTTSTPAGPFTVVADDSAVLASGWTADVDDLIVQVHPTLRPLELCPRPEIGPFTRAVVAYHDGDFAAADDIPVRAHAGAFIEAAWKVLREVTPGEPVSYAELAARAGRPAAVRAAASACARNPAALFVPCHRVVRTGGGLGGFRWGLDVKRWLLAHEALAPWPRA